MSRSCDTAVANTRRLQQQRANAEINDAARLANKLQRDYQQMTRTEALLEAERIQRKHGIGWSLAPEA